MTFEIGIGVFLLTVFLSRFLAERALRLLTPEQKLSLIDGFSGMRAYSMIPIVLLIGVFFALTRYIPSAADLWLTGYWIALALYVVVSFFYTRRRLIDLGLPRDYLQLHTVARAVRLVGLGSLVVGFL